MRPVPSDLVLLTAFQDAGPWRIVYERDYQLWSAKEDGTDVRPESEKPAGHVLSPDGKRRVYVSDKGGQGIWVADADGGNPIRISARDTIDDSPSWTSDGRRVVFHSHRNGRGQVWIMDADGSNRVQLTEHREDVEDSRGSPIGDRIAYIERYLLQEKVTEASLRTMNLVGGDRKTLIERGPLWGFAWNPAGDQIACGWTQEIRIVGASDGKMVRTFKLADVHKDLQNHLASFLVWRPDGGAIACNIIRLGGRRRDHPDFGDDKIFVLPLEGKPAIVEAGGRATARRWTR